MRTLRAQRELAQAETFYFFDPGVFQTLRPRGPLDRTEEINGAALEGLVAQNIRAWISYFDPNQSLYYWRTRVGLEVDFVVYGPNMFYALEIKFSKKPSSKEFRGLREFKKDYPESSIFMLYSASIKRMEGDILLLPIEEFSQNFSTYFPFNAS